MGPPRDPVQRATERWFVSRGVPHLIHDYNARDDILTRAAPFLTVVFLAQVAFVPSEGFDFWVNVGFFVGSVALALALVALVNGVRGRRRFERPTRVGVPEVALFVFVPAGLRVLFGAQYEAALNVLVENVVLLVVAYLVTSYGVIPTAWWALGQLVGQLRTIAPLVARALPLLLLVTMFMFFNAELWKVVDDLPTGFLAVAVAILVVSGSLFVVLLQRSEIVRTAEFASWAEVAEEVEETPVAGLVPAGQPGHPTPPELDRRGRLNLRVVLFFAQATQILAVTVAVTAFYIAFGTFTVIETTIEQWTGSDQIDVWWRFGLFGNEAVLTGELVRTSLFVGAIAGLQFTVSALTDASYRADFADRLSAGIRQVQAVRVVYLTRIVRTADA